MRIMGANMISGRAWDYVDGVWDRSILPELVEYIRIPNKSPAFDPEWQAHGYMDEAVARFVAFAETQPIPGLAIEVARLAGRTPLIFIDIPGIELRVWTPALPRRCCFTAISTNSRR
jgi:hypothetical protein